MQIVLPSGGLFADSGSDSYSSDESEDTDVGIQKLLNVPLDARKQGELLAFELVFFLLHFKKLTVCSFAFQR